MKKPTELEVARGQGRRCSMWERGGGGGALLAKCVLGPSVCLCVPPHTQRWPCAGIHILIGHLRCIECRPTGADNGPDNARRRRRRAHPSSTTDSTQHSFPLTTATPPRSSTSTSPARLQLWPKYFFTLSLSSFAH